MHDCRPSQAAADYSITDDVDHDAPQRLLHFKSYAKIQTPVCWFACRIVGLP